MTTNNESNRDRDAELRAKQICRFCLAQNVNLTNIYSNENRTNAKAPLPLQIMSCVSIEVFTNDGMPNTICDPCRLLLDHCYRLKQMFRHADTALKQYPLTGVWPNKLDRPKYPDELMRMQCTPLTISSSSNSVPNKPRVVSKRPTSPKILNKEAVNATSPKKLRIQQKDNIPYSQTVVLHKDFNIMSAPIEIYDPTKSESIIIQPPRILNKGSIKILNKGAAVEQTTLLTKPTIQTSQSGNIELVSEIVEDVVMASSEEINNAEPVLTHCFPCDYCERTYPLRQLLDIHMANHVRERNFCCSNCDKRFFSKYDLAKHMLIHTGEKPFECIVCKKKFSRSTLLNRHEKIHTDQPKLLCVYCEKEFLSEDALAKHTVRHEKSRPFPCSICDKSFAFKQGLERHEVCHLRKQPFACEHCDRSFTTPNKLARHLTAHAGARPYPCRICPKSYLLSHHLSRHLRSHKEGSSNYKCHDCNRTFASRDSLIYHSAVHATVNLTCPLCLEVFPDVTSVTDHVKSHIKGEQYACEFCDLIFTIEDKLEKHKLSKHVEETQEYDRDNEMRMELKKEDDSDSNNETIAPDAHSDVDSADKKKHSVVQKKDEKHVNIIDIEQIRTTKKSKPIIKTLIDNILPTSRKDDSDNTQVIRRSTRSGINTAIIHNSRNKEKVFQNSMESENKKLNKSDDTTILTDDDNSDGEKDPDFTINPSKIQNKRSEGITYSKATIKQYSRNDQSEQSSISKINQVSAEIIPKVVDKNNVTPPTKKTPINLSNNFDKRTSPRAKTTAINLTKQGQKLNDSNEKTGGILEKMMVGATKYAKANKVGETTHVTIGDKVVRVKKILVKRSEVEEMSRNGLIERKGDQIIINKLAKSGITIKKSSS